MTRSTLRCFAACVGILAAAGSALAQPCELQWEGRTGGGGLLPRFGHAMAYDSARGVTVLFGGTFYDGARRHYYDDTWEWDGTSWTLVATTGKPRVATRLTSWSRNKTQTKIGVLA